MSLAELCERPGLPPETRLLVAAAAACWRADWSTLAEAAALAQQRGQPRQDLEETLLQSVLFCGFPRVVSAFGVLGDAWPTDPPPTGGALHVDEQEPAGRALFAAIYGKNDASVRAMLRGYHQEFHDFVLTAAYGRILTRPHLPARVRELLAVAVLAAQDQARQFAGHARGALQLGATRDELVEALVTTFGDGDANAAARERWIGRLLA